VRSLIDRHVNIIFLRDLIKMQEGIGEKIGMFIFFFTTFLASVILAFVKGWELTLVMLTSVPVSTEDDREKTG